MSGTGGGANMNINLSAHQTRNQKQNQNKDSTGTTVLGGSTASSSSIPSSSSTIPAGSKMAAAGIASNNNGSANGMRPGGSNRFLLSPNPQRNSPIPPRSGGINSLKDDLANQRFFLTSPLDVFPFPSTKGEKVYPDFFPWKKTKEEDTVAIDYVPRGFHQPAEVSNETASACTSMLPLFKQWTSTPALSYFLVKSMQIRENMSRINTASTFKPPPRVTLTDQKREAWLKDLASPEIPLRKLSRTIPHGIRNRALLEQCYMKKIPISRAVWFARCVGANELRGLKRKGANASGGLTDSVWIKDWTMEVIDYLEKTANNACSSTLSSNDHGMVNSDSSPAAVDKDITNDIDRLDYLTRLTGYLFMESLLDHQTFLSWLLRYLCDSTLDNLPVSLLFTRMYWNYFIKSQPMSQFLARALIQQYSSVISLLQDNDSNTKTDSAFLEVVDILRSYMKELFVASPNSFVIPRLWGTIGPILEEALVDITPLVETVRIRNEALSVSNSVEARLAKRPNFTMTEKLDGIQNTSVSFTQIARNLVTPQSDHNEVLLFVFEWATSISRKTIDTVYTTVALCEVWDKEMGWNISAAFIDFLFRIDHLRLFSMDKVYMLAMELLRNDLFSMGDYFRKLISMGLLFIERFESQKNVQVMLLKNLPMHYSGANFEQQRRVLLERALERAEHESEPTGDSDDIAVGVLNFLFSVHERSDQGYSSSTCLTNSVEEGLGGLLCYQKCLLSEKIVTQLEERLADATFYLDLEQAAVYIRVLIILADYRAVYHSIWLLVPRIHTSDVLHFLANTVKNYRGCFGALGQLADLIQLFVRQFNVLKVKAKLSRSLCDLIKFSLEEVVGLKPELRLELESFLRQSNGLSPAADISTLSPISDISSATSPINGDPILSPYGITETPDSRTLPSVLSTIGNLLLSECTSDQNDEKDITKIRSLAVVLQYLRDIDSAVYDESYVSLFPTRLEIHPGAPDVGASQFYGFCIAYECIPLSKSKLNLPLIEYVKSEHDFGFSLAEQMSFEVQCSMFKQVEIVLYLQDILSVVSSGSPGHSNFLTVVGDFLEETAGCQPDIFFDVLIYPIILSKDSASMSKLFNFIRALLPSPDNGEAEPFDDTLFSLVLNCNVFNISLLQGALCLMVEELKLSSDTSMEDFCTSFLQCMARSHNETEASSATFGDLILKLSPDDLGNVLERCEEVFLKSSDVPLVVVDGKNVVPELLEVVDATAQFRKEGASKSTNDMGALENFVELLVVSCETFSNSGIDSEDALSASDLMVGILLLIKIVMIRFQRSEPGSEKFAETALNGLLQLQRLCVGDARFDKISGILVDCVNVIQKDMEQGIGILSGDGKTAASMLISSHDRDLFISSDDSYLSGLVLYDKTSATFSDVNVRAFDLLEDANPTLSINDVPLDLALFHATLERKNPR